LKIYQSYVAVSDFFMAYVYGLMYDDELGLHETDAVNIESCLMELAAAKVDVDKTFAPKAEELAREARKNYTEWLTIVKDHAFRAGTPLRAELMDMVNDDSGSLADTAEAEAFGFNESRLHPDIYMNELLVGIRVNRQMLVTLMKKLGAYDEFELDLAALRRDETRIRARDGRKKKAKKKTKKWVNP
jgi:hypothetical protein